MRPDLSAYLFYGLPLVVEGASNETVEPLQSLLDPEGPVNLVIYASYDAPGIALGIDESLFYCSDETGSIGALPRSTIQRLRARPKPQWAVMLHAAAKRLHGRERKRRRLVSRGGKRVIPHTIGQGRY